MEDLGPSARVMLKEVKLAMKNEFEMPGSEPKSGFVLQESGSTKDRELCPVTGKMLLTVILPVYKEEGNIDEFLRRIIPILQSVTSAFEIIFAMDPSPDRTEERILAARKNEDRVKLLKFSRRFGQPFATLAGLQYSVGKAIVVIDVDLQHPPELIIQMIEKWREGYEVVYAQRRTRAGETWIKKVVSE